MNITIEENSGFCYGVVRVIGMAEEILRNGEEIWCLEQIVHNEAEVERLEKSGMKFISHDDLPGLKNTTLLIRAHGEPPSTYEIAGKNNLMIIEGTCPIVQKLQKKIKDGFKLLDQNNEMVVIFGKPDHPEVIGLMGQTENKAVVIRNSEEARTIPLKQKIVLFSQTTMNTHDYKEVIEILRTRLKKINGELNINKTICSHVAHRRPGLEKFAAENDVIIFVGGKRSSNARSLFEVCKLINNNTYFISDVSEINCSWFIGASSTGICGATSTPDWQLQQVAGEIRKLCE